MADVRHVGREEEFFRINPSVDSTGLLADFVDRCRQLPLHLCLPIQCLNECLSKATWKELRQHGQGLSSLCDTMVRFYQVNSRPCFFLFSYFHFLTPRISPFGSSWGP